jgi:predicted peptidase
VAGDPLPAWLGRARQRPLVRPAEWPAARRRDTRPAVRRHRAAADALLALLDRLEGSLSIDTARVYLTGLSMGAYGAYELAIAAPERFAALLTVSGAGNPVEVCRLEAVPTWIVHGAKDDVIPVEWGREMARRLENCKGNVRWTLDPDAGHDAWTKVYDDPATYEWLLAHRRTP